MLRTSPCAAYGTAGPVTGGSRGRQYGLADLDPLQGDRDRRGKRVKGWNQYQNIGNKPINMGYWLAQRLCNLLYSYAIWASMAIYSHGASKLGIMVGIDSIP